MLRLNSAILCAGILMWTGCNRSTDFIANHAQTGVMPKTSHPLVRVGLALGDMGWGCEVGYVLQPAWFAMTDNDGMTWVASQNDGRCIPDELAKEAK